MKPSETIKKIDEQIENLEFVLKTIEYQEKLIATQKEYITFLENINKQLKFYKSIAPLQ